MGILILFVWIICLITVIIRSKHGKLTKRFLILFPLLTTCVVWVVFYATTPYPILLLVGGIGLIIIASALLYLLFSIFSPDTFVKPEDLKNPEKIQEAKASYKKQVAEEGRDS